MISTIKAFFKKQKQKRIARRDQRKLVLIRRLIIEVVRAELPGNIILHNGKEKVVQDVVISLRKNELKVQRTLLSNSFTKKQRAALNWKIKQGLKLNAEDI